MNKFVIDDKAFPKEALESSRNEKDREWDQFTSNKSLFKIESTYSENLYTTEFNMNKIPEEVKKKAEMIETVY
jgi:PAB1-binding protein PBP1